MEEKPLHRVTIIDYKKVKIIPLKLHAICKNTNFTFSFKILIKKS